MALATGPRMLLLDEPMAGMGPEESARMVALLRELKQDLTILLIEHDMEAVFALADRITRAGLRPRHRHRHARGHPRQRGGAPGLSRRRATGAAMPDAPLLEVEAIEAGYGRSQVLFGLSLGIAPGEMVTLMGRNGMGKTTTVRAIMGLTPASAGSIRFAGEEIRASPSYRIAQLGIGLVPEGRQVFPNLTARENLIATAANRARDRRSLDARQGLRPVPAARRAHRQHGQPALGRRAADAGGRPRAHDQSAPAHPRRGDRGSRAADPRRDLALPRPPQGRGPGAPRHRQERRRRSPASPTATT